MSEVEKYISQFNPEIQSRLNKLRELFFEIQPSCEENIRYNMPAYKVGKDHLYFAAYKKHIGFYPVYSSSKLEGKIAPYRGKGTKDSLHFLHAKPLPIDLIKEIIQWKAGLK